jgi:disulfide bond formation protein DsbB
MGTVQRPRSATTPFAFIVAISLAAVGAALVSQHVFNMQPCAWCVLQRLIFLVLAAFGLLGLVLSRVAFGRLLAAGLSLLGAVSGIAAALWLFFYASSSTSCKLTLADRIVGGLGLDERLPEIFEARASCADAAVDLLGLPYALWALAVFGTIALAALIALRGRRSAGI